MMGHLLKYLFLLHSLLKLKHVGAKKDCIPPYCSRIGVIFPMFQYNSTSGLYEVDAEGVQYLAAFKMAVDDINAGLYKDRFPNVTMQYTSYGTTFPFIDDVKASLYQNTDAFGKKAIIAQVASANDAAANAAAQIDNGFGMTQVSYGATGSYLSYVGPYPYFMRTAPDDAFQGKILARLAAKQFGWKTVTTFAVTDGYGTDGVQQFFIEAALQGIKILSSHNFRPGQIKFGTEIQSAKDAGARIFMLFMRVTDAARLIEAGYDQGLFVEGTQILGSDGLASPELWLKMKHRTDITKMLKGLIAIRHRTAFDTPSLQAFVKRWRALPRTAAPANSPSACLPDVDDDGRYLYQGFPDPSDPNSTCAGIEFKDFSTDGSDIAHWVPYVYDAVLLLAQGFQFLINDPTKKKDSNIFNTNDLQTALVSTNVTGITGVIQIRLGDPLTGFGYGDRESGLHYDVLNFQPSLYYTRLSNGSHLSEVQLESGLTRIGTWSPETGFFPCNECGCTPIFNTPTNSVPMYKPDSTHSMLSSGLRVLIILMFVLCILLLICVSGVLLAYRGKRLVRSSQPAMLAFVLLGFTFGSFKVLISSLDLSDSLCQGHMWLSHMSFFLVFGTLAVKTWRVHMIVNSSMKKVKITNTHVIQMVCLLMLVVMCFLSVYNGVGDPHKTFYIVDNGRQYETYYYQCEDGIPEFAITIYASEAATLLLGAYLSMKTRNVPDAVNDSKNIAMAMYIIIALCILLTPIVYFLDLTPTASSLLVAMGFATAIISTTLALFMQKILLLMEGADLDAKLNLIRPKDKELALRANKSQVSAGEADDTADTHFYSSVTVKELLKKGSRESNVALAKLQIEKWNQILQNYERKLIYGSGNGTGSSNKSSVVSSVVVTAAKSNFKEKLSSHIVVIDEGQEQLDENERQLDDHLLVQSFQNGPAGGIAEADKEC